MINLTLTLVRGHIEMKIAFVSCTKLKEDYPCPAKRMYQKSHLFRKAIAYIEQCSYDDWFILSAKYGLLEKEELIAPYDVTLNDMKISERKRWAYFVLKQIDELNLNIQQIDFYAGKKYREFLLPALEEKGICCHVPLKGKSIGQQQQFYSKHIRS